MEITHPDRIVFPDCGITKGEVVDYYREVAEAMLPHVAGRPLTLQRFPKGIAGQGFMQKNASSHFPDSIRRVEVPKRDGVTTYPVVDDPTSIPYLANQGTITFHVWSSTVHDLDRPDRLVFDLDPSAGDLEGVRRAAAIVRALLDELGLPSIPVATGSKGYHVVAPVAPTAAFDRVSPATHGAAALLAVRHPELLTIEFRKENRAGRVFVDWLRNHRGATSVAPWSLRPRPGAPVAVPLTWDEMAATDPDAIRLGNVRDRLDDDPLADLTTDAPDPTAAMKAIDDLVGEAGITIEPFDRFRA